MALATFGAVGTLWRVVGILATVLFWCTVLYALVFNPKFGQGDSRTLVLTIGLAFGVVLTVILGIAFISD